MLLCLLRFCECWVGCFCYCYSCVLGLHLYFLLSDCCLIALDSVGVVGKIGLVHLF